MKEFNNEYALSILGKLSKDECGSLDSIKRRASDYLMQANRALRKNDVGLAATCIAIVQTMLGIPYEH